MCGVFQSSVLAGWLVAQVSAGGSGWDTLVQRGVELRLGGDEAQALAIFREAARTHKTPRLLAQMALAEQSMGRWREAEVHLLEALESHEDPWMIRQQDALADALVIIRRHLGNLELLGGNGGDLFVDGRPEGTLPRGRSLRLEVGTHRVEVKRPGAFSFVRDVEITSDATARESVELMPLPPAPRDPPPPAALPPHLPHPPQPPAASAQGVLGWGFVGAGVAAAAFGVGALATSNARAADYNGNAACTGHADEPDACASAASATRGWRVASVASFAVGGALAAGGVVVLLWKSSPAPVRVQLVPGNSRAHLSISRAF